LADRLEAEGGGDPEGNSDDAGARPAKQP